MNRIFRFRMTGIAVFLVTVAAFSLAAMCLWNAIMPEVFGLPALGYLQSLGLVVLARILFGGSALGPWNSLGGRNSGDRLFHGNALREKWMNMSDDERLAFIQSQRGFSRGPRPENEPNGETGGTFTTGGGPA